MKIPYLQFIIVIVIVTVFGCGKKESSQMSTDDSPPHLRDAPIDIPTYKSVAINDVDTVKLDNEVTLYFKPIEKQRFENYYPDQKERDSLSKPINNSMEKAIKTEKYLAKNFAKYFTSTDSTLFVYLENGDTISFPKWNGVKGYYFDHYFVKENYVLLFVQYFEGADYMLINRRSGFKKLVFEKPYFSQNGGLVLASNGDFSGISINGIGLYRNQGDSLSSLGDIEIKNWEPGQVLWMGTASALIEKRYEVIKPDSVQFTLLTIGGIKTM